jgi:hypothetical protein
MNFTRFFNFPNAHCADFHALFTLSTDASTSFGDMRDSTTAPDDAMTR